MLGQTTPSAPAPGPSELEARLFWTDEEHVQPDLFDDARMEAALVLALGARASGTSWIRHHFAPCGFSLVGVGAALRVALHTWPDRRAMSFDAYGTDPDLESLFTACLAALLSSAPG